MLNNYRSEHYLASPFRLLKAVHDPLTFANDVVPEPADETLVEEEERKVEIK